MKIIIMCGGSGTRLWPLSTNKHPKQFVKLFNEQTLFELTVQRNMFLESAYTIVTNKDHLNLAQTQIQNFTDKHHFILEPVGRNTAPAIALAALNADPEEKILILPSDHLIKNQQNYERVIKEAIDLADQNFLVTFGIKPDSPETGYGYIQFQENEVLSFKEKPSQKLALEYIQTGNYLWNSGMFCFKAGLYLDELKKHSPEIYQASQLAFNNSTTKNHTTEIDTQDMLNIPSDSIDYAVMEKSNKVKVIPSDISWHDLGSFESLLENLEKDQSQNHINKDNVVLDSSGNLCLTNQPTLLIGVKDLIVVQTDDGLVVLKKGQGQRIKEALSTLKIIK